MCVCVRVRVRVHVFVCVSEREREREREAGSQVRISRFYLQAQKHLLVMHHAHKRTTKRIHSQSLIATRVVDNIYDRALN